MVSELLFIAIFAGLVGGIARAMHGALKSLSRGESFSTGYLLITIIIAGIIGAGLGSLFDYDFILAALSGYAGTDILENIIGGYLPNKINIKK